MDEVNTIMTKLCLPAATPIAADNLELFFRFSDQFDCSELKNLCETFVIDKFVAFYSVGSLEDQQRSLHNCFVDTLKAIFSAHELVL